MERQSRQELHFSENGIVLDPEFNSDKLGWRGGDYFKLINIDGRQMLIKQDKLVKFVEDGKV